MYTAKIVGKTEELGRLVIDVEFSNGTKSSIERIEPDNKDQFNSWVAGRLHSLNSVEGLKTELAVDQAVDGQPEVVAPTAEETAKKVWLQKMNRLRVIKDNLIDLGIVPDTHPKVVALRDDLKATLVASYIDEL